MLVPIWGLLQIKIPRTPTYRYFIPLGEMPRHVMVDTYDKCRFNFLRKYQTVVHFAFPPACGDGAVSPCPCVSCSSQSSRHALGSHFMCIPLVASHAKHLSGCLAAICNSGKYLLKSLAPFLTELSVFLLSDLESS